MLRTPGGCALLILFLVVLFVSIYINYNIWLICFILLYYLTIFHQRAERMSRDVAGGAVVSFKLPVSRCIVLEIH